MTSKYEAFVLAAETGSFKSTAEQLGYTQAGISYMMSSLESEMGTALFARDHSAFASPRTAATFYLGFKTCARASERFKRVWAK